MSLQLRALQLRVVTPSGLFGTAIEFGPGLVVLRADNTKGKSTCVQSIIYALGLEGMFTASTNVPLAHAMTHTIQDETGASHLVLESRVLLEIGNAWGDILTMQREVKGDADRRLIKTWLGPKLTNPSGDYKQLDRFVRMEGAAQRPDGFHFVLAGFLGWSLPTVTRYQSPPCPLYLECIFPLFVVEQKHGWSAIQAKMPTHLGVREPSKRAIEFVLDLKQYKAEIERQRLEGDIVELRVNWTAAVTDYANIAKRVGGLLRDLSKQPAGDWPPAAPPQILVFRDGEPVELGAECERCRLELKQVEDEEIPRVEQISAALAEALASTEAEIHHLDRNAAELLEQFELDRAQVSSVEARLNALEEDLRHHRDIERLRKLGSQLDFTVARPVCPTCGQDVADTLLPQSTPTMTVEENIELLHEQIATFEAMRRDAYRVLAIREGRLLATRESLDESRARLRSQKRTLGSDGKALSEAAIRARLELEARVRTLQRALDDVALVQARLASLATDWRAAQAALQSGRTQAMSESDESKLAALEASFLSQLREFGFESISPDALRISRQTYRPEYEGFDLGFDVSASDMIRTIWSYVQALLEVSKTHTTNHAGLLVFDEPRQQSASRVSFATFLKRAARAAAGAQIIVATSEELPELTAALRGEPHALVAFEGRILKRLATD